MSEEAKKPVKTFKCGLLSASVWSRQSSKGGVFYNATMQRAYKDQSDQWNYTSHFGREDLATVAWLSYRALEWICAKEVEDRAAARAGAPEMTGHEPY